MIFFVTEIILYWKGDVEDIYCGILVDNQKYAPVRFFEKGSNENSGISQKHR